MIAVKVVLSNGVDGDELELGPFNQGVLFEDSDIIDVASGEAVVTDYKEEADHEHSWTPIDGGEYTRAFVQGVDPPAKLNLAEIDARIEANRRRSIAEGLGWNVKST